MAYIADTFEVIVLVTCTDMHNAEWDDKPVDSYTIYAENVVVSEYGEAVLPKGTFDELPGYSESDCNDENSSVISVDAPSDSASAYIIAIILALVAQGATITNVTRDTDTAYFNSCVKVS